MSFLWYCLIAKENKPKGRTFYFMIISCIKYKIHTVDKKIRAPPMLSMIVFNNMGGT